MGETVEHIEGLPENNKPGSELERLDDILESIPDQKKRNEVREEVLMLIRNETFVGPIPPPSIMAGYESILPGAADRILSMAEKQEEHRIELENAAIHSQLSQSKRGQIFGFIVFLIGLAAGVAFALKGMVALATTFLTVTMVSIITVFVLGKREIANDLEKKGKSQEK